MWSGHVDGGRGRREGEEQGPPPSYTVLAISTQSHLFMWSNVHSESLTVISVNVRINTLKLFFEMHTIDHQTQA